LRREYHPARREEILHHVDSRWQASLVTQGLLLHVVRGQHRRVLTPRGIARDTAFLFGRHCDRSVEGSSRDRLSLAFVRRVVERKRLRNWLSPFSWKIQESREGQICRGGCVDAQTSGRTTGVPRAELVIEKNGGRSWVAGRARKRRRGRQRGVVSCNGDEVSRSQVQQPRRGEKRESKLEEAVRRTREIVDSLMGGGFTGRTTAALGWGRSSGAMSCAATVDASTGWAAFRVFLSGRLGAAGRLRIPHSLFHGEGNT
jgi:hypothetical protein